MASIADRVRELIASSGSSHRAFAHAIALDEVKLSKSLRGTRRFSTDELNRIAVLAGVSIDWLVTGGAVPPPAPSVAARAAGGSAGPALAEAERLSALREVIARLGHSQPWRPVPASTAHASWASAGEALAERALERVKRIDADKIASNLPSLVEEAFGVDVCLHRLGRDFDGLAYSSPQCKVIVVATSTLPARQRFTVLHELGHLLAGDDQGIHLDDDVFNPRLRKDATEQRANAFASAFLMPPDELEQAARADFDQAAFAALSCKLGVSPSALAWRLLSRRLIDAGTCDQLRHMSGREAARLSGRIDDFSRDVALSNAERIPGLLHRDLYSAYDAGLVPVATYAALLQRDPADVHRELVHGDGDRSQQ